MEWRYAPNLLDAQARIHLSRGELDRGLELAERGLQETSRASCAKLEARALETRGRLLLAMDRRDEAEPALHQALEFARSIGHPPMIWRAASLLAEVALCRGLAEDTERWQAQTLTCVERSELNLPDAELRAGLRDLGHRLITDPLASHR